MKLTFLLFINILFLTPNQIENDNFKIENNEVVWQKIYETKLSKENLITKIKTSGKFENIEIFEDKITANISSVSIDYKSYGESEMSIPIYLSGNLINGFLLIEMKDNKYRVNIKNIKFIQKHDDGLSNVNEITEIETYALSKNNSVFKNNFLKKPSKILDFTFTKLTEFKNDVEENKW